MKKLFILLPCLLIFQLTYGFNVRSGSTVTISQAVQEDLYIAGGTIIINAPIHGDLVVAGGTVTINDSVMNDIILAGGTITFNGYVGDDIRCAGGQLSVRSNIAGHMVVSGGTVTIDPGVTIGGLMIAGGEVIMNGTIKGELRCRAGTATLNGIVEGDMDCRAGKLVMNGTVNGKSILAAESLEIGSEAAFMNDVNYWTGQGEVDFKGAQKQGRTMYDESLAMETGKWYYAGYAGILWVLIYLTWAFLMIFLVQYLFSNTMRKAGIGMSARPATALGYGFLFVVAVPVAAVIAMVTVVGLPIGILLLLGYMVAMVFASVITAEVLVNWFNQRRTTKWAGWQRNLMALLIFIVIKIISLIPFIGWLAVLLLVCLAFGAILLTLKRREPAAVTVPPGASIPPTE